MAELLGQRVALRDGIIEYGRLGQLHGVHRRAQIAPHAFGRVAELARQTHVLLVQRQPFHRIAHVHQRRHGAAQSGQQRTRAAGAACQRNGLARQRDRLGRVGGRLHGGGQPRLQPCAPVRVTFAQPRQRRLQQPDEPRVDAAERENASIRERRVGEQWRIVERLADLKGL